MDAQRFDRLVKSLRTRRSVFGVVAGIVTLLGLGHDKAAAKKCKKKCGPCKRCKKGKCRLEPVMDLVGLGDGQTNRSPQAVSDRCQ